MGAVEVHIRGAGAMQAVRIGVAAGAVAGIKLLSLGINLITAGRVLLVGHRLIERVREGLCIHLVQKADLDQVPGPGAQRWPGDWFTLGEGGVFTAGRRQAVSGDLAKVLLNTALIARAA